jgi:hypothetical protein
MEVRNWACGEIGKEIFGIFGVGGNAEKRGAWTLERGEMRAEWPRRGTKGHKESRNTRQILESQFFVAFRALSWLLIF